MTAWRPHGPLAKDQTLYFLHIPKTAGTSLRTALSAQFDGSRVCPFLVLPKLLPLSPDELRRFRLFNGHHGRYLYQLLRFEPITVTMLRDPVARTVSHYRHLQRSEQGWLHDQACKQSLEEFINTEAGATEVMNLQARYLGLGDIQGDYFGFSELRHDFGRVLDRFADPVLLERAIELLDRCAFVGLQERMEESMLLLTRTFAWRPSSAVRSLNPARTPFDASQLTDAVLERIRELTRLDQAVYDHATRLFESRLATVTEEGLASAYTEAMLAKPRTTREHFAFDRAVNGENWYVAHGVNGRWTRWTGPGTTATLDLPLAVDRPLVMRFFARAHTMDVIESVRVFANDQELDLAWWQMDDPATPRRTFQAEIPAAVLQANDAYCRLRFEVGRTVVPAEEFPNRDDTRRLGLQFHWLDVVPA